MKAEEARFVWVFVFFDLPVGTKPQRTAANRFRNVLKDDGFIMLQFSVYARICRADDGVQKHMERVQKSLPTRGSVRALQVTDKQYDRMRLMLGEIGKSERVAPNQLILL
jgi:CRISPR-associated protein Cas2